MKSRSRVDARQRPANWAAPILFAPEVAPLISAIFFRALVGFAASFALLLIGTKTDRASDSDLDRRHIPRKERNLHDNEDQKKARCKDA